MIVCIAVQLQQLQQHDHNMMMQIKYIILIARTAFWGTFLCMNHVICSDYEFKVQIFDSDCRHKLLVTIVAHQRHPKTRARQPTVTQCLHDDSEVLKILFLSTHGLIKS